MIEPKLAYYIEEFNTASKEMRQAMNKMDKFKCYIQKEYGLSVAHDRSIN